VTVNLDDAKAALEGTLNVRRPDGPRQSFVVTVRGVESDPARQHLRFAIELAGPDAQGKTDMCVEIPAEVIFMDRPSGWGALIRTELRQWLSDGRLASGARVLQITRQRGHR
jgi:hypothetical protein